MRRACGPLVLLLVLAPAARAADPPAFSLELFRPAIDSKGYVTVNATELLGHLEFSLGLVTSFAHHVLDLARPGSPDRFDVEELLTPELQAALGLFDRVEVGVSLPVHILFGSRAPAFVDPGGDHRFDDPLHFSAQGLGAVGLHVKARLLDGTRYPVGLGLSLSVYAPSGDASRFLGEGQVTVRPELILDRAFGRSRRFRMALNVGALVRPAKRSFTDGGATLSMIPDVDGGGPFCQPAAAGVYPAPGDPACGTGQTRALGSQLTYGLGLSFAVVPRRLDLVGELFGYADLTGEATGDPLEGLLAARAYVAGKSYFTVGGGAGILPRTVTAAGGMTGSPEVRLLVGFVFEPSMPRREPAEVPRPPPPVPAPPKSVTRIRGGRILVLEPIFFETNKAVILPISYPTLDAVALTIQENPQLLVIEVQGHADERGDDAYNLRLTEARARAVKDYLIRQGVAAERLRSRGYGETRPVCTEHDEACWSKNRRVEFVIVRRSDEP